MAFIRLYEKDDFDDAAHICRVTLPPSLSSSEPAYRLAPYIWTHQYTLLSPSTCHVLDDGTGRVVGYCIGFPDVASFCAAYPSYVAGVLDPSPEVTRPDDIETPVPLFSGSDGAVSETCLAQWAYNPAMTLVRGNEDLLAEGYRATMHIDILPEWQGKGWGKRLIETFVESVRGAPQMGGEGVVSKGIWIGVAGDNAKVVAFYQKQGFKVKDRGRETDSICLVRDF